MGHTVDSGMRILTNLYPFDVLSPVSPDRRNPTRRIKCQPTRKRGRWSNCGPKPCSRGRSGRSTSWPGSSPSTISTRRPASLAGSSCRRNSYNARLRSGRSWRWVNLLEVLWEGWVRGSELMNTNWFVWLIFAVLHIQLVQLLVYGKRDILRSFENGR